MGLSVHAASPRTRTVAAEKRNLSTLTSHGLGAAKSGHVETQREFVVGEPEFLAQWAISVPIPVEGSERGEPRPVFLQNGKLAKMFPEEGGTFGPDHRRVSAVVTIEEELQAAPEGWTIRYEARVVHNPFTKAPLPETMFAGNPQFVRRDRGMSRVEK